MSVEEVIRKFKKDDGVTLVELLAAIVILALITTAFLAFFTQAGRTNNRTDEKNEATFIAVEEMERITNLAQLEKSIVEVEDFYKADDAYTVKKNDDNNLEIKKTVSNLKVELNIIKKADDVGKSTDLYHATVVIEEGGQNRANMQTVLSFAPAESTK